MSEADTPARPTLPTEATDFVTLRELEQRLHSFQKLYDERTRYEREILSTRENSLKDALKLAHVETQRRLDELNHAHQLAAENWARSLPRELFEQWKADHMTWREGLTRALVKIEPHGEAITSLNQRLSGIETSANRIAGGFVLIGMMGLAGVIALLLGLARLAGVMH